MFEKNIDFFPDTEIVEINFMLVMSKMKSYELSSFKIS